MNHASEKQLKGFVKEEKATSKLYVKLGFKKQGSDEARHSTFFANQLKKKKYWKH